ncbi:MAG: fused MFS/spermidine synthase [Planctomycetota bacterium]|jgi:spermidine synthase
MNNNEANSNKYLKSLMIVLLFISGLCALSYQIVWLRDLRLVFGASTPASAAVIAIFMAGLSLGSALLGPAADKYSRPLKLFAYLEFGIALFAALSPLFKNFLHHYYISLGGLSALGAVWAAILRLLISLAVLGAPTFLMGATLPAAVRFLTGNEDRTRKYVSLAYSSNTLGGVLGALAANFIFLEHLGAGKTLFLACLINVFVAVFALLLNKKAAPVYAGEKNSENVSSAKVNRYWVYGAGFVLGFVFFLLELVWYRMLSPILGGSTYTFGLILAFALFGIGIGSAAFWFFCRNRVSIKLFIVFCGFEAFFIALPYIMGDQLALLAAQYQPDDRHRLFSFFAWWSITGSIVILPPAFCSGFLFPLLIALLGEGNLKIARHTGKAYAFNTCGAILGALAGGFGLLTIITAPGAWVAAALSLVVLGFVSLVIYIKQSGKITAVVWTIAAVLLTVIILKSSGPTAVWRHSGIGAGRAYIKGRSDKEVQSWMQKQRQQVAWEAEGIECSIALINSDSYGFISNGKDDGNVKYEAATQVMLGLLSAVLHPDPETGLLIGLGTGCSAGWLAEVESLTRLDVVELEPRIADVAAICAQANCDVMKNPKVNLIYTDAREVLTTAPEKYDLIVSGPSNPYRAGLASLFTVEFYQAVKNRMAQGGLFTQWIQAYEIDEETMGTIYTTLNKVFPEIETWQPCPNDLLIICADKKLDYKKELLSQKLGTYPFKEGLANSWLCHNVEGLLARYVADSQFPQAIARTGRYKINTDDRMFIEYGFIRTLGTETNFNILKFKNELGLSEINYPLAGNPEINKKVIQEQYLQMLAMFFRDDKNLQNISEEQRFRLKALRKMVFRQFAGGIEIWNKQSQEPQQHFSTAMLAISYAYLGQEEKALPLLKKLEKFQPLEAKITAAVLWQKRGQLSRSTEILLQVFHELRSDPWPMAALIDISLNAAERIARRDRGAAQKLSQALKKPFSVYVANDLRLRVLEKIKVYLK